MQYGIVIQPVATIYEIPAETMVKDGMTLSAIADEAMYGTGLAITGAEVSGAEVTGAEVTGAEITGREAAGQGFLPVRTFYGYTGYVRKEAVRLVSLEEMMAWEEGGLMVTTAFCVDVVSVPKVQGVRLVSLFRGALVSVIPYECGIEGWGEGEAGRRPFRIHQGAVSGKQGVFAGWIVDRGASAEENCG